MGICWGEGGLIEVVLDGHLLGDLIEVALDGHLLGGGGGGG